MKISRRPLLLLAVFCLTLAAHGQRFTLEQVMSSPFPSDLAVASKTDRIAWVFNARGIRNVWVADAPDFRARQVTHDTQDDGQAIVSLRITPDGRSVVYGRGSEINEGGEVANPGGANPAPKQQIWTIDVDSSKEPRLLGDLE